MRSMMMIFAALVAIASPAAAYENFIPLGHSYSPDDETLPPLNSDQDQLNSEVDVEEAATWVRDRSERIFNSRIEQLVSDQKQRTPSDFIDY